MLNMTEFIQKIKPGLDFFEIPMPYTSPASEEEIRTIKEHFQLNLSTELDLFDFLRYSNGAIGCRYLIFIYNCEGIFVADRDILEVSRMCDFQPPNLLPISDDGCGNYFGYKINNGEITDSTIYYWDVIDNACTPFGKNLMEWATLFLDIEPE